MLLFISRFISAILFHSKQFGPMTVEIKSQKKTEVPATDAASKAPDLKNILNVDPLLQGQALLAAGKKRKKLQKRAGLCNYSSQCNTNTHILDILQLLHKSSSLHSIH